MLRIVPALVLGIGLLLAGCNQSPGVLESEPTIEEAEPLAMEATQAMSPVQASTLAYDFSAKGDKGSSLEGKLELVVNPMNSKRYKSAVVGQLKTSSGNLSVNGLIYKSGKVYLYFRGDGLKIYGQGHPNGNNLEGHFRLYSRGNSEKGSWTAKPVALPNIVEIAAGNPNFSTLVGAVQAAGLVDTLKSSGPFTVFAPTNDAFAKLSAVPGGEALKQVLLYHVTSGAYTSGLLAHLKSLATVQGGRIKIEVKDGAVILNSTVKVIIADILASNGVIHVIDTVLIPPPTIAEIAAKNPDFSTLVGALVATGLDKAVADPKAQLTVFAPTNAAFEALKTALGGTLPSGDALKEVLLYHVAGKVYDSKQLARRDTVETLQGGDIGIDAHDGIVLNDKVKVIAADIEAGNGIIHVIDTVLLPTGH